MPKETEPQHLLHPLQGRLVVHPNVRRVAHRGVRRDNDERYVGPLRASLVERHDADRVLGPGLRTTVGRDVDRMAGETRRQREVVRQAGQRVRGVHVGATATVLRQLRQVGRGATLEELVLALVLEDQQYDVVPRRGRGPRCRSAGPPAQRPLNHLCCPVNDTWT
jgi:hypothetical protein